MGGLGSFFDTITQPFGLKLFGGSNYADSGMGDKSQAVDKQAQENYKFLGDYGRSLLGNQPGAGGRTPAGPSAMDTLNSASTGYGNAVNGGMQPLTGVAAGIPGLLQQQSDMAGLGTGNDPYALSAPDLQQFNQEQGAITHQRTAAESHLRQSLASRGITSGPALDGALQMLHQHYDAGQQQHSTQFHQNIKANKQQQLQSLIGNTGNAANLQSGQNVEHLNALHSLVGDASQRIGQGTSLVGAQAGGLANSAGLYQQGAQLASQNNNNAWNNITGLAGFGLGGGFNNPTPQTPKINPSIFG